MLNSDTDYDDDNKMMHARNLCVCVCVCALVFVSVSVCLCFCVLALERMMYISEQVHTKKSSILVLSISASIRFQISRNGFQGI